MQRRSPVGLSDVTPVADDDDDDFINTEFHNQKIKLVYSSATKAQPIISHQPLLYIGL
jgi:hypothetical protein